MKLRRERFKQGSIRKVKRSNGPDGWEFRFTISENGVRKHRQMTFSTRECPTETSVRKKVEAFLLKLNHGTPIAWFQQPSFNGIIDHYFSEDLQLRPKTLKDYQQLTDGKIRGVWGEYKIADIQPYLVENWLKTLPYSPETKRHIKAMLHRLFGHAMKLRWLEAQINPMSLVRVKGRGKVIERVVLTPEQVQALRQVLPDPYRLMVELCCFLGLRVSETLGLKWEDFDSDKLILRLRRSSVRGIVDDLKSEASRDDIALLPEFAGFILRWRALAVDSEWVFQSRVTGRPMHADILAQRHLRPLAASIGVPRLSWHVFRHTFRTWLDSIGTPVGVQQKMMRHSHVATTMNIYGAALMESKKDTHGKLMEFSSAKMGFGGVAATEQVVASH
jgi:integrase